MTTGSTVTIPANRKVSKISVRQDRSESAEATFMSDINGRWQTDGSTGYLEQGKHIEYAIQYPQLFGPAAYPFNIQVGGTWLWSWNPQGMAKTSYTEYPDHFTVGFFPNANDPYPDLVVEIWHA
jgi:hypothetical protein